MGSQIAMELSAVALLYDQNALLAAKRSGKTLRLRGGE
jgi:hypothetical protein